jgi:hypothetical protein
MFEEVAERSHVGSLLETPCDGLLVSYRPFFHDTFNELYHLITLIYSGHPRLGHIDLGLFLDDLFVVLTMISVVALVGCH